MRNTQAVIRKALAAKHRAAFTIERAEPVGDGEGENQVLTFSCASDTPITHFLMSRWELVDIQLAMTPKALRTDRLKAGAAFLMDHDTRDQRGVIDDFEIAKGKLNVSAKMSRRPEAQELYQDMADGIRTQISLGFIIHKLTLVEERKGEPDLYRADDWEPYEISSVSVAADISVGVGRAMAAYRDGMDSCPECEQPIDDCSCDTDEPDDTAENSRAQRAISTRTEKTMKAPAEIAAENAAAEAATRAAAPAVETRSPEQIEAQRAGDIMAFARVFGKEDMAREMLAASKDVTLEDVRSAISKGEKPSTAIPKLSADEAARAAGGSGVGFEAGRGTEVEIDRATRQVIDQRTLGLSDTQLNAIHSRDYREAFVTYLRKKGERNLTPTHLRALAEGADSDGGFLVPAEFLAKMVEREAATTELRSMVTNLQTGSDKLTMPKNAYSGSNLYTTGIRVSWVDEKTGPSSESDATDFGNITIPVHTAMMYHDVTNNMVEDSAFDIMGWLADKFRETADVVTENVILNGSGIGQPEGILLNPGGTNQPGTVVTGDANLIKADGLIDLAYSIYARYLPNARFIFNRLSTSKAISKLKDSQNRYLFAYGANDNGVAGARPKELLGFPFTESDFMPDVAASAYPIIFGDPRGYYLVNRVGFSVQVLNEIVATSNKVRVLGRMRLGGQVAEDWRLKIQTVST